MPGCTGICESAPNDYAPSLLLGAGWVQSVFVSIYYGRENCLVQSSLWSSKE